ncbi:MAG: outer membrane lipid asymmetry maintenance protein MlaD [Pseudomonadota bacterium]
MAKLEQPVETLIGAAVLAVAVGFGIYAADSSGNANIGQGSYELKASFSSASGISAGTDVRIAGVKVGSVSDVALDPQSYRAMTTLRIRDDVELDDGASAKIDTEGLLGGAFVSIEPGAGLDPLESGDEILITQGSISLGDILGKVFTSTAGSN